MWGAPYGYSAEPEDDEVDNDRPEDADYNVDEEDDDEEDEDEEPEYQDDSDGSEEDEDDLDEEEAQQLRAVAAGAPLSQVTGVKRRRGDSEERPAGRAAGSASDGGARRNVVRINLRQQTVKPRYSELSDDEEMVDAGQGAAAPAAAAAPLPTAHVAMAAWGQPAAAAWQQQAQPPAVAWQQQPAQQQPAAEPSWQQQLAQPAAAAAAQEQAAAAAAVQQAWQTAAVPDWAAHLPPAGPAAPAAQAASAPVPQAPIQPPWMKHMHRVSSASALPASTKQSSGSAKPHTNFRSTPGFYAESDDEDEQDSRAKRMRKVPHVLLPEEELALLRDEAERVITHREREGAEPNPRDPWATREFYIKWARRSYLHCTWELKATLSQHAGYKRVLNYIKKVEEQEQRRPWLTPEECELMDVQKQMEEEMVETYKEVERVIAERHFTNPDGSLTPKFLCKWRGLPYCEGTYETREDLAACGMAHMVDEHYERERRIQGSRKTVEAQRLEFQRQGTRAYEKQPDYLKGGTLRDYQLDGLNWMVYSWSRGCNGILADEMGLGKTVQCASMIGYLSEEQQIAGPFLVVVPLSTVPNWIKEFRKWIPSVNTIVYVGDAQSREVMRAFEWETGLPPGQRQYKFDALITTYEMVLKDSELLRPIRWGYMMVDEAHRLKNDESALYKELIQWSFKSKLLVTGTPLQNNIKELWALLHFLHPEKFPDCEEFEEEFDMNNPEAVARLHATLRPHLLRRVIKDVEKSLPPKNERILRVGMTPLQRQYYRWILTRNFKELNKGARSQLSLLNIITELKKCCNHPFLFQSAEEEYRLRAVGDDDVATRLVVTSGKMVLLDKLLTRLKQTGHRVLVFSQMVRVLDIISDYMRLRGFQHQRLDGSTPSHLRHQAMEHFNAPGSQDFAFLLSTRAGGLGINLATADTVIIFDSDWNPQNDLQAMSRAHRIGQKDTVNIYRFVTSGSVEEDILERAKRKMVLDHLVIQRMDTSGRTVLGTGGGQEQAKQMFGKEEMAAILRFGAEELFREGHGDEAADERHGKAIMEEDLDAILARAEVVEDKGETQQAGRMGDLLGQFNVATFKTNEDDAAFWNRLIPEDQRPKQQTELIETGVRASRMRQLDAEQLAQAVEDDMPGGEGGAEYTVGGKKKKKGGDSGMAGGLAVKTRHGKGGPEPGPPIEGAHLRVDVWPQEVDAQGTLLGQEHGPRPADFPPTLTRKDAAAFVKAAKQRGVVEKLDLVAKDTGGAAEAASEKARLALWYGLQRACAEAVRIPKQSHPEPGAASAAGPAPTASGGPALSGGGGIEVSSNPAAAGAGGGGGSHSKKGPKEPEAKLDFFGVEVRAQEVLDILRQWRLAARRLAAIPEPQAHHFKLSNQETPALTQWMRTADWGPVEDAALLLGCWRHGVGAWERCGAGGPTRECRTLVAPLVNSQPPTCSHMSHPAPAASHVETRAYGILRQMEKMANKPAREAGGGGGGGIKTRAGSRPPLPPPGGRGPGQRISPAAAAERHAAAHQAAAAAGPAPTPQDEAVAAAQNVLGAETITIIRKLRTLQRKGGEMDAKLVLSKTKKYMATIGARIHEVSEGDVELRHSLWEFVSQYTENQEIGERLEQLYERMAQQHHPHEASSTPQPAQQAAQAAPAAPAAAPAAQPAKSSSPAEEGELPAGAPAAAAVGPAVKLEQAVKAEPGEVPAGARAQAQVQPKPDPAAAEVKPEPAAAPAAPEPAPKAEVKQEAAPTVKQEASPIVKQEAAPVVKQEMPPAAPAPAQPPVQPQVQPAAQPQVFIEVKQAPPALEVKQEAAAPAAPAAQPAPPQPAAAPAPALQPAAAQQWSQPAAVPAQQPAAAAAGVQDLEAVAGALAAAQQAAAVQQVAAALAAASPTTMQQAGAAGLDAWQAQQFAFAGFACLEYKHEIILCHKAS
ncbi:hypothetical protein ABPG75_000543 [Micractinium tetrahymenae]